MLLGWLLACGRDVVTPAVPDKDPTRRWGALLRRVVTRDGMVDYDTLRADPGALRDFVGWIAVHGPETDGFRLMDDDRRLAWHLNAYNALVLWSVVAGEPISSVRDRPGFFVWQRFEVDGERTTLYWYESGVILPTYEEPLAHAALNCASRSCPPLRHELYEDRRLRRQLVDQMKAWVRAGAVVEEPEGFVFNAIFDWYADDFRSWAGAGTPCEAVRPYAGEAMAAALDSRPDCPHRFAAYDWSLNGG